ncbi:tripartite motif-containing protein 16-like isoform X2 [Gadus macrocephalus]|uniref:tripartite motif-containing protein 16-like isoform X2 n=1 Tax=Gadus macrocephalus TaxID=80720 RepID=UPI0028CB905A|nr:tripartite motif-containing protein 16-like isoform X2 [Gadus macrocephalus]
MASSNTSLSEENFSCSICLDEFNSPVSTPCGHNFCRTCITTFWDDKVQHKCPVCNQTFPTRPDLQVNTFISEMVDHYRKSVLVKEQPCVGPGEVPCDVCTGTQLKALKSCLMCLISYCQTHLEPHQRVSVLKKHQLVEPMDRLEDRMCKKHKQLLELYCHTEQVCVCLSCTEMDHKSHPVVPLKEEYEVKRAKLRNIEFKVQQMIQERQRKIQEIKDTFKCSRADADRAIADGVQVLTALMRCIEKCRDNLNQTIKEELKSTEKQAEGLIKELEQEIEVLTNRSSEVKQLSHTEDHLHFLQTFRTPRNPPPTRDWTTVEFHPPSFLETLRSSLDQLEETLNMDMKKLPVLKSTLTKYACELTLDPNTTHRRLSLSEDHRMVTMVGGDQSYPDHPERFDYWTQVLCREGLTGRCYWEVEKKGRISIGMTYREITRKGSGNDSRLGGKNTSWSLQCSDDGVYIPRYNNSVTEIRLPPAGSNRVGVYLDRPAGTLSFYRVSPDVGGSSDTLTHIHTFQSTFTQDLYPGFVLGPDSSVCLCRSY